MLLFLISAILSHTRKFVKYYFTFMQLIGWFFKNIDICQPAGPNRLFTFLCFILFIYDNRFPSRNTRTYTGVFPAYTLQIHYTSAAGTRSFAHSGAVFLLSFSLHIHCAHPLFAHSFCPFLHPLLVYTCQGAKKQWRKQASPHCFVLIFAA